MRHELLLVRHGKSGHPIGFNDVERALTDRGVEDALRLGAWVRDRGFVPDRLVSSHAQRAAHTAVLMSSTWPDAPNHVVRPGLYMGGFGALQLLVAELPEAARRVVVVGHNPDLETAVEQWAGAALNVTTANLVRLGTDLPWADAATSRGWQLLDHIVPKLLWRAEAEI